MTGSGHLITGGSLATAVLDGLGVQDGRSFTCMDCASVPPCFLLALFLLVLFLLTLTLHSERMRNSQGGNPDEIVCGECCT